MPVLMSTSSGISFIEEDDDDVVFDIIDDDADIDGFIRGKLFFFHIYGTDNIYLVVGPTQGAKQSNETRLKLYLITHW